jgi:predicted nucleic acid-binding protein
MPVVDASVVIDWIAPGVATTAPAVKLLDLLARRSAEIVGRLLFEEVSNALISGVRRRWSGAAADASHSLLLRLPIRITDDRRDLD